MLILILLFLIVIIGSAFFSGLEAALFSVPQSKVHLAYEQKRRGAKALLKIKENLQRAIIVVVIGNNIVNIVGSIFVGVMSAKVLGETWLGIVSAMFTFLIIIFGEIIPKTIGENNAERISLYLAPFLLIGVKLFTPIIWFIEKLTRHFHRDRKVVSEEELHILSEIGHQEGSIEKDEKEIIQKVFLLNDLTARDIMTPRTVVVAFQKDSLIGEIRNEIYDLNNSRIPVYNENIDDIIGVCYRKNLLIALAKDEDYRKIESFAQDVLYVREDIRVDDLLQLFLTRREQIAIVKDEFEGTSGLVTLEDVLEQLVGEIVDEDDEVIDTRMQAQKEAAASDIIVEEGDEKEKNKKEEESED